MNERIQKLLERELAKLEILSASTSDPLGFSEIKSLDTLIKAHRTFSAPESPAVSPAADDPASQTTEALLNDIASEQKE